MKFFFALITSLFFIFGTTNTSCRSTKKIASIVEKKDSIVNVIEPAKTVNADSIALVEAVWNKIQSNRITYNTFNAKAKVDYEDGVSKVPELTAFIRIRHDSIIWINVEYAGVYNVARIAITKDSFFLLNKKDDEYTARALDFLKEKSGIPFDFKTIEDILVGNPVYLNKPINFFQKNEKTTSLSLIGTIFKHFLTVNNETYTVSHSKLDDVNISQNRTCDLTYEDYEIQNNVSFSSKRQVIISEKSKIQIDIKFKNFTLNQPLTFPFSVPKNYKRL